MLTIAGDKDQLLVIILFNVISGVAWLRRNMFGGINWFIIFRTVLSSRLSFPQNSARIAFHSRFQARSCSNNPHIHTNRSSNCQTERWCGEERQLAERHRRQTAALCLASIPPSPVISRSCSQPVITERSHKYIEVQLGKRRLESTREPHQVESCIILGLIFSDRFL